MNKRIQSYREKIESYNSTAGSFDPPLTLVGALVSRWGPGDRFSRTKRDSLSLSLITMGNALYKQEGRQGSVDKGAIFLAHKGCSQTLQTGNEGFMHKRSLIMEGPALELLVGQLHLTEVDVVVPKDGRAVAGLFREAYRLLRQRSDALLMEASAQAYRILLALAASRRPDYPYPLRLTIKYIEANIHRVMTVAEMALAGGLSERHATRLFHQHLACSPMEFCIRQRMALAQNMLVNTKQPVKLIAAALGYDSQLYFSTLFRRRTGMCPTDYRQRQLTEPV